MIIFLIKIKKKLFKSIFFKFFYFYLSHPFWFLKWLLTKLQGVNIHPLCLISPKSSIHLRDGMLTLGKDSFIHDNVIIDTQDGIIEIEDNVSINPFTVIYGHGGIIIRSNTRIATSTVIVASNHIFESKEILIRNQGVVNKGIVIGNDVWIGANVVVLDGVEIGNGCVIGASTLISRDTKEFGVYVGNPAKLIRFRE